MVPFLRAFQLTQLNMQKQVFPFLHLAEVCLMLEDVYDACILS